MLLRIFPCPKCHRTLGISAHLVKPWVRCPACRWLGTQKKRGRLKLAKGSRQEVIALIMGRSSN